MLTFEQIAALLIPVAHELLQDNMRRFEFNNLYNWQFNAFNIEPTSSWENELVSMVSTRMWPEYDEQKPLPFTEWDDTDSSIFTLSEYVDSFIVHRRYLKYGEAHKAVSSIFPKLKQFIPDFLRRGLLRHSQLASVVFLDAFAGNFYIALDGQALCSLTHTDPSGGTIANRVNAQLNATGLQAMWDLFPEVVDQYDVPLGIMPDTIIVGPKNKIAAFELISNTVKPGASNSEKNFWQGAIDKVVICPWLIENVQTDASEYWFMMDSRAHTLTGYIGEQPHILDDPKLTPLQMHIIGITAGVYGWHDWRAFGGSDGSGT